MFAKNISTFLLHLVQDGKPNIDVSDEVIGDTLLTRDGEVVNNRIRELLSLEPLKAEEESPAEDASDSNAETGQEADETTVDSGSEPSPETGSN